MFRICSFQGTFSFLTDVLSAIQIQKPSFYTWITGKTSLSKQRFPADVGYTFRCRSIFIGSFPWTFLKGSGSHLLSHAVSSIVSSAASVLTIVFGMGTGVSPKRIATGIFVLLIVSAGNISSGCGKLAFLKSYGIFSISDVVATEELCSEVHLHSITQQ